MRITVLGSKGMLGHVVARVLAEAGHEVRNEAARYDPAAPRSFMEAVLAGRPEAVVNCIGVRPGPGVADGSIVSVNATLPLGSRVTSATLPRLTCAALRRCRVAFAPSGVGKLAMTIFRDASAFIDAPW